MGCDPLDAAMTAGAAAVKTVEEAAGADAIICAAVVVGPID